MGKTIFKKLFNMLKYNYKIRDSIGGRKEQQDYANATLTKFGFLIVVCDGMGGAKGGATASNMAVNIILKEVSSTSHNSPSTALTAAITKANSEIFNRSRNEENCRGMGTTVAAIILQEEKATIAHVGDSRIYQLRQPELFSKNINLIYRTNDHSKVFELVKRGIMNEEQARVSDESNVILRALGIRQNVDVELKDNIPYLKGDRFLLCTDGICGALPEKQLLKILNSKDDIQTTLNKLISTIDQIGFNNGGGHDNLAAAIIECNNNSKLKNPASMQSKIIITALASMLFLSLGYIGYTKFTSTSSTNEKELKILQKKQIDSLINSNKDLQDSIIKIINGNQNNAMRTQRKPLHSDGNDSHAGLLNEDKSILESPKAPINHITQPSKSQPSKSQASKTNSQNSNSKKITSQENNNSKTSTTPNSKPIIPDNKKSPIPDNLKLPLQDNNKPLKQGDPKEPIQDNSKPSKQDKK